MSQYTRESSDDSDWVQLTPPAERSPQTDSTHAIDLQDESSLDQQSFGGTQNPRPPTNPRPRPPRQHLTYLDDDSRRSRISGSSSRYYPGSTSDSEGSVPKPRRSSRSDRVDRWYSNDESDFYRRVVVPQYRYAEEDRPQYQTRSPVSDTSSLAITAGSRATNYDAVGPARLPSLISLGSTGRASGFSARTDSISSMPNRYILEEDEDGNFVSPGNLASVRGELQCPLAFLGCREWFNDLREWEGHHRSHYRGQLPRSIHCPFQGCGERFLEQTSQDAWARRGHHIISCPYRTRGVEARPNRSVVDHLQRIGVIPNAQEQVYRQTGSLGDSGRYLESSSSSRDRRRERRPEDYRSPRSQDYPGSGDSSYR